MASWISRIQAHISSLILVGITVVLVIVYFNFHRWKNHDVISYDVISYYGYLPSFFHQHDLTLQYTDEDPAFWGDKVWYETAPNGGRVFKTSMGMAYCYLPFYLAAHGWARLTGAPADGYGPPYKVALVWSSLFYALAGLYMLRKLLRIWFTNEWTISLVLLTVIFGTNLFNYVTYNNAMSHSYSFALITTWLYTLVRWYKLPTARMAIFSGLLAGWIVLVRPVNILILLLFLGYDIKGTGDLRLRLQFFFRHYKQLLLMAMAAFFMVAPQLVYWKSITGSWLFYSYTGERFYFLNPHILEGLFSWRKGWLLYTPLMALAFISPFALRRHLPQFSLVYPVFLALLLYITFSWWDWWYGGGMSQRALIDWYGVIALGMAALFTAIRSSRGGRVALFVFLLLGIGWNQLNHIQYRYLSIHYDSMTRKAYLHNLFAIQRRPGTEELWKAPDYAKARKGEKEYYWE